MSVNLRKIIVGVFCILLSVIGVMPAAFGDVPEYGSMRECLYDRQDSSNQIFLQSCAISYIENGPSEELSDENRVAYKRCLAQAYRERQEECRARGMK